MSVGMLLRNVNERGDARDEFLLGVGMLQMNFYWAWGHHRGILMSVGTLLRNVNEHGDAIEEF